MKFLIAAWLAPLTLLTAAAQGEPTLRNAADVKVQAGTDVQIDGGSAVRPSREEGRGRPANEVSTAILRDLRLARGIAASAGERVWQGYARAPFGMLLIDGRRELLLCQTAANAGFGRISRERVTGCSGATRSRSSLPDNLLAAFPVFGQPSTIVMGTPGATRLSRGDWMRTILHEHFHQWQYAAPGYYARVDALDLKDGDESGMWMLNFPVPYTDAVLGERYHAAAVTLADAIEARGTARFAVALSAHARARQALAEQAGPRNWRYLEFELWQEGGARWTEIAVGRSSADVDVESAVAAAERRIPATLRSATLAQLGRELAYPFGAGELMVIDACLPDWRKEYRASTSVGGWFARAVERCGVQTAR